MEFIAAGEKIKRLRRKLELTQEDLQSEKVSPDFIKMIENGNRDLNYSIAMELAEKFNKRAEECNFALNVDANYLMRSSNEEAEIYCLSQLKNDEISKNTLDEILRLSEEYDLLEVKAKVYFKMGQLDQEEKKYDSACIKYEDAIKIYKAMGKNKKLGKIYLEMGICKGKDLQHDSAIIYFNLSKQYGFVYDDLEIEKISLYNLAIQYKKINKIELALEIIEGYLSIADEKDKRYNYGINMKAICYELMGDYDKAISIYKRVISNIENNDIFLGYAYNNLGLNYCHKNDFTESLKYFEMAGKFRSKLDKPNLGVTFIEKSNVYVKQEFYTYAIKTIDKGLKYVAEYNDLEYLIKGYYILASIYSKLNDWVKLQDVYKKLIDVLKIQNDKNNLKVLYDKMAFMYINQNKIDLCKKYLSLSNDIN